jgi:hypothetical protein
MTLAVPEAPTKGAHDRRARDAPAVPDLHENDLRARRRRDEPAGPAAAGREKGRAGSVLGLRAGERHS